MVYLSLFVALIGIMGLVPVLTADKTTPASGTGKTRVLLVGASVGKDWKLQDFPSREKLDAYAVESMAVYQFDKTEALKEILMRPDRKFHPTRSYLAGFFKPAPQLPTVIILKECAAYFPGDLASYQQLVKSWVRLIREKQIEVMLATVIPVTRLHAGEQPGRIDGILAYNDWIRDYARQERIPLLDLEAALRLDDATRFLNDSFTSGDGLHVNEQAYAMLDRLLAGVLLQRSERPI